LEELSFLLQQFVVGNWGWQRPGQSSHLSKCTNNSWLACEQM
jgi:hypothetical protein